MSLDSALMRRVENLADAKGLSRSAMVEQFIRSGIEQEEIAVAAFSNPVVRDALMKAFAQPGVVKAMAKTIGEEVDPQQLEQFNRGMELLSNYSGAIANSTPPAVAAEQAIRKVTKGKKGKRS